ncbi:MAG TPA: hypothetical protein PKD10_07660 [Paracoccaceae bacterium]|nr:hypothetical protein [Paracoccaceae bacterium]HMO72438.1 hypothetical protein [Paracoccaceae bacterium]
MPRALSPALLVALVLAACAALPPAPQTARLSAETLTVTLSDGTTCRTAWAAQGRLNGCGPGFGYEVRVVENPNLLRQIAQGLFAALGAEGALAPMAEVVLTDAAGATWRFVSPPPVRN